MTNSIAAEAAWRLDADEVVEIEIDDSLQGGAGGGVTQIVRQHRSLHHVRIHLDATVLEEHGKAGSMPDRITAGCPDLSESGFIPGGEPRTEGDDTRQWPNEHRVDFRSAGQEQESLEVHPGPAAAAAR
jgi:hypothetical protein